MQIDLTGKNILVTGASKGIGAAIAQQLGQSGARVAVHYNTGEKQAAAIAERAGNGAITFHADLGNNAAVAQLFSAVLDAFGHLDVIINNAGILAPIAPDADDKDFMEVWNKVMQVNLNATALLSKKAVNHFQTREGGIIINVSSRAAHRGDTADYLAYAASKAGVAALTKSIARAYGKSRIAAFTIAPGFTRTGMADEFIQKYGKSFVMDDLAWHEMTEPENLAPLITLLASGLANHATGATFDINAGSYVRA